MEVRRRSQGVASAPQTRSLQMPYGPSEGLISKEIDAGAAGPTQELIL